MKNHIRLDPHPPTQLQSHNHTLQVKLNRLKSRKAILEHRLKQSLKTKRRARTRTLIQMGGLLNLTDLPALSQIMEGDDLQADLHGLDKAATLLGMLLSVQDQFQDYLSLEDLEAFKKRGMHLLKSQQR